jgi:hypothetical protein
MYDNIILMFYIIIHNISFYVSMLSMNRSFFDRTVRCNRCAASLRLPPVDNSAGSGNPKTFPRRSRRPNSPMDPDLPPDSPRPSSATPSRQYCRFRRPVRFDDPLSARLSNYSTWLFGSLIKQVARWSGGDFARVGSASGLDHEPARPVPVRWLGAVGY